MCANCPETPSPAPVPEPEAGSSLSAWPATHTLIMQGGGSGGVTPRWPASEPMTAAEIHEGWARRAAAFAMGESDILSTPVEGVGGAGVGRVEILTEDPAPKAEAEEVEELELTPPGVECCACNEMVSEEDATFLDGRRYEGYYCQDCADQHLRFCRNCETTIHECETRQSANGYDYCRDCYSERYTSCDSCNEELLADESYCDGYGEGTYCESCQPSEKDSGPVFEASENVLDHCRMLGQPADDIRYGIELEMECPDGRSDMANFLAGQMEDYAILKEDGSLRSGFEIVTTPATLDLHRAELSKRLFRHGEMLAREGVTAFANGRCGMHVHISRKPLTQLQIGKMQVFLHNPENADFVKIIAQRDPSEWADISADKRISDVKRGNDNGRYTALNLENSRTVELRIFKGNLRQDRVFKNLEFTQALVRWCATGIAGIAECADWQAFIEWVAKQPRKEYPALVAFLRERTLLPAPINPRLGAKDENHVSDC